MNARRTDSRDRMIAAAQTEIRRKGYNATHIEDICAEAGVTKGSFFHHFDSKDAIGAAALETWSRNNEGFFAGAPYHAVEDPVLRLLAYVDFRIDIIEGPIAAYTCLAGTMVQELHQTNAELMALTSRDLGDHNARMAKLVRDAQTEAGLGDRFDAEAVALFMQAATQGAFIVAKAGGGQAAARTVLAQLRRHLELLFSAYLATLPGGRVP